MNTLALSSSLFLEEVENEKRSSRLFDPMICFEVHDRNRTPSQQIAANQVSLKFIWTWMNIYYLNQFWPSKKKAETKWESTPSCSENCSEIVDSRKSQQVGVGWKVT